MKEFLSWVEPLLWGLVAALVVLLCLPGKDCCKNDCPNKDCVCHPCKCVECECSKDSCKDCPCDK